MSHPVYYRRCHVCWAVSENPQGVKIERCQHCGKSWAPFYYFDERFVATQGDKTLRPPLLDNEYYPIQGLTVYWEGF